MVSIDPVIGLKRALGEDLVEKIQSSKILVVGSGGIGCELLKDLALSGFQHVEVIDLDTIDVSNLNRQLLFRSQHVGMPKCTVACQVAQDMVGTDTAKYVAHHGNVCDNKQFNMPFVSQFQLVLNALDNVEARRRVNRLCLAAGVPLLEAGTTGYLGQVTVIHKPSQVACYECNTQETQKVYPICTIRSTPSMPVHTIVWAKELYKLLFHDKVDESMLFESTASPDSEKSTYMEVVGKVRDLISNKSSTDETTELKEAVHDLLLGLYSTEIEKQLSMDKYKTAKKTPTPLKAELLSSIKDAGSKSDADAATGDAQSIWKPPRCIAEFLTCMESARNKPKEELLQEFDKDDDLAMRFVTAASNLRAEVFGIEPLQSLYSAKGIAGNIIPAIATTNAICAGLQILQLYKILQAQMTLSKSGDDKAILDLKGACSYVNCIRNKTRNGLYLTSSVLEDPNPKCFVCKNAVLPLSMNTKQWTLDAFLKKIAKGRLGFENPTLMIEGDIIWEEGEGSDQAAYEPNLLKKIQELPCGGIHHGTVIEMEDFSQDLTIQVSVIQKEDWDEGESAEDQPFLVGGEVPKAAAAEAKEPDAKPAAAAKNEAAEEKPAAEDDDDDICIIEDVTPKDVSAKRPAAESSADVGPARKKARVSAPSDDVIEIE